jgi:hypothetical protein
VSDDERMNVQLVAIVVEAVAADDLARFWAQALRWSTRPVGDGAVLLVPSDVTSFGVLVRPGGSGKVGQNRIHFDLTTASSADQTDTVAELESIGATPVDVGQGPDETHVVLADPEGNELCVLAPGNRFLAGCPRLGAVNCDGTRALGQFYSAALGWPLVWDQDEETAIQAPDGTGPKITWSGPPLMPRLGTERIHLHLAPAAGVDARVARDHLVSLGATLLGEGARCDGAIGLADVDGNALCLVRGA